MAHRCVGGQRQTTQGRAQYLCSHLVGARDEWIQPHNFNLQSKRPPCSVATPLLPEKLNVVNEKQTGGRCGPQALNAENEMTAHSNPCRMRERWEVSFIPSSVDHWRFLDIPSENGEVSNDYPSLGRPCGHGKVGVCAKIFLARVTTLRPCIPNRQEHPHLSIQRTSGARGRK